MVVGPKAELDKINNIYTIRDTLTNLSYAIKKNLDLFAKRKKGTIIILSDLDKISEMRASDRGPNFYEDCDKS